MQHQPKDAAAAAVLQEPAALTVDEFCHAHRIGRAFFYRLLKDGEGPRVMKVGKRTLISKEAAAEWRQAKEAATAQEDGERRASSEPATASR